MEENELGKHDAAWVAAQLSSKFNVDADVALQLLQQEPEDLNMLYSPRKQTKMETNKRVSNASHNKCVPLPMTNHESKSKEDAWPEKDDIQDIIDFMGYNGNLFQDASDESGRKIYIQECQQMNPVLTPMSIVLDSLYLKHLNLRHCRLSDKMFLPIAKALVHNIYIKSLDVSNNFLTFRSGAQISSILKSKTSVIDDLNLSSNKFSDEGGIEVFEGIRRNNTIRVLHFADNDLGNKFAIHVARVFDETNLKNFSHMDLSTNRIGEKGAIAISHLFLPETRCWLSNLQLQWNQILCKGGEAIFEKLLQYNKMVSLSLSWASLGDSVAPFLEDLLVQSSKLQFLDISHNRLGKASAIAISNAFENGSNLIDLQAGYNNFGMESSRRIIASLCKSKKIRTLGLENTIVGEITSSDTYEQLWELAENISMNANRYIDIHVEYPPRSQRLFKQGNRQSEEFKKFVFDPLLEED